MYLFIIYLFCFTKTSLAKKVFLIHLFICLFILFYLAYTLLTRNIIFLFVYLLTLYWPFLSFLIIYLFWLPNTYKKKHFLIYFG